jgi:hypothetical protein
VDFHALFPPTEKRRAVGVPFAVKVGRSVVSVFRGQRQLALAIGDDGLLLCDFSFELGEFVLGVEVPAGNRAELKFVAVRAQRLKALVLRANR